MSTSLRYTISHHPFIILVLIMKLKRVFFPFLSFAVVAGMVSCSDSDNKKSADDSDDSGISSLEFSFDMKSARKYFRIANPEGESDYTLTLETTVQWPEEIGDYDIKPLQDTIISLLAGKRLPSINEAMKSYISDAAQYGLGDKITEVDTVPAESAFNTAFYAQTGISVSEITDELITFNCVYDQYLGGAHNMTGEAPFTYNFKTSTFVSLKWLFNNPESPELLKVIKEAIAEEKDMTVEELEQSMIVPEVGVPESVYLENGSIMFHYNPYAVLPYSFGAIDARVSPYMIRDMLTPAAEALLVSE